MTTPERSDQTGGHEKTAISNLIVGLFREYAGRGPTRARTAIQDDLVACVLHDTLTRVERTLVSRGETESVLQRRRISQGLMRDEAVAGVEKILEREVIAFLGDNHIDPDVAVLTWVLAPKPKARRPESADLAPKTA